ncbi:hypothetical protein N007_11305 [Alicyclobacillus acidoterrestris ATCC 49025]|nr:hypothetical protein N007_11305 [Alicyclobacillus acidoterrestris ATCC 49025]
MISSSVTYAEIGVRSRASIGINVRIHCLISILTTWNLSTMTVACGKTSKPPRNKNIGPKEDINTWISLKMTKAHERILDAVLSEC